MTVNTVDALEKLGLVRDALAPALEAGIELKSTTEEPVTFQSLPHLLASGAAINLIDDQGRLAAVTFEGDDVCAYSAKPSFCQIAPDGSKTRFYLWAKRLLATAVGNYRPGLLRLGDPLFAVQRDQADSLIRIPAPRARHVFRDRMMPWPD
jgi:hypothetical protein